MFLFCGLFLVALALPVATVILGTATFGRIGPDSYLPFLLLLSFSGYGFYASCKVLFAHKPAATQVSILATAGLDSHKPARRIGLALAAFGLLGMIYVWPAKYVVPQKMAIGNSPTTIFEYGPIFYFAFGSLVAYAFRQRTAKV